MKLYQYGVGRTGTTLILMILNRVFEDIEIRYSHHHIPNIEKYKDTWYVVGTMRDWRDVLVSRWRILLSIKDRYSEIDKRTMSHDEVKFQLDKHGTMMGQLYNMNKMAKSYNNMLWLKYEDFYTNYEHIFWKLETYFGIKISPEKRKIIIEETNIEQNKKRSSKFANFDEYDLDTHIHGHHIYKGESEGWKKMIREDDWDYVNDRLYSFLTKWGYSVE